MRHYIYIWILVFISCNCRGQENEFNGQKGEFKTYANGLIYDESTMHKLGSIVDSLNLKFRSCDLSHPYYAYPQGMGSLIDIPNEKALKMIEGGVSYAEFAAKYPRHIKQEKIWIVKTKNTDYEGNKYIEYSGLPFGRSSEPSIQVADRKSNDKTSGWVVNEEGTTAFYFERLDQRELPFNYARLVQYVDCMVDTTAEIYLPKAKNSFYEPEDDSSKAHQFISWAENFPGEPAPPDYEKIAESDITSVYTAYSKSYSLWDSLRILDLDAKMKIFPDRKSLLSDAADESLAAGKSDSRLEFYAARYLSKNIALQLMRSRKVMGQCSMDQSPRYHAMNICKLAAETAQWDIFLRSHLNIMNDRFERQSDGSYAWGARKTYLKELEELDIPAVDLLIGTSLRVTNVSPNHYWGSIGRVGRALADASNKNELETRLIAMIQDEKLDACNRLLMAYLFDHYIHNLEDENSKALNKKKLEEVLKEMPGYVREVWGKE